jgi:sarcosine oxidase subunit beta
MNAMHSDVIVIGAGIVGTSASLFLCRQGLSVTLLERGLTGQQASGVNFGGIRRQGRALPQLPMSNRALEIWRDSAQLLGEDIEFLASGHTRVCYHEHDAAYFDDYARDARAYGLNLQVFHGAALRARYPFLGREVLAASHSPLDGHANPRLAAPAFARAAVRAGAHLCENTEIVQIDKEAGEFRICSAQGKVFRAPILVIAAGAWASALSEQFGEAVPLIARGPQMAVTEPLPYVFKESMGVYTSHKEESVYFRQIPRGNLILGGGPAGPADAASCRASVLPENTVQQLAQFRRLVPALAPIHVIRVWSGVESYLPDGEPVIGPSSTTEGLYYAFGFCGSGFQIGPGVGATLAELIGAGATSIPLDSFSIKRFLAPIPIETASGLQTPAAAADTTSAQ